MFDPEERHVSEEDNREALIEMAEFEELSAMHGQSNSPWSEDDEED